MILEQLQEEIKNKVGILSLVIDSDLLINKEKELVLSKRRVQNKPNIKHNHILLIKGITQQNYINKVLEDSVEILRKNVYTNKLEQDIEFNIEILDNQYMLSNHYEEVLEQYKNIQELIVLKLITDLTQEQIEELEIKLNDL